MFVLASLMPCALSSSCPLTLTYLSSLFGHLYFVLSVCILIMLSLSKCPNSKKFICSLFFWNWSFPAPAPWTMFSLPLHFKDVQRSCATENSWWNWFFNRPGVAKAVLHTASSLSEWLDDLFSWNLVVYTTSLLRLNRCLFRGVYLHGSSAPSPQLAPRPPPQPFAGDRSWPYLLVPLILNGSHGLLRFFPIFSIMPPNS